MLSLDYKLKISALNFINISGDKLMTFLNIFYQCYMFKELFYYFITNC